jgi:hypothetical protein
VRQVLDQTAEGWCDADRPYGEGDRAHTPPKAMMAHTSEYSGAQNYRPTLGSPDETTLALSGRDMLPDASGPDREAELA